LIGLSAAQFTVGFVGTTLGQETFTDLEFTDDVALMAEMLEVLILGLEVYA